ncbi:hypothetical protein [Nostoc sp.]|uniref:hypothetical protein n=1 Tax=Nostoc sp. TaxID=1180 RepID=UPI002FF4970A
MLGSIPSGDAPTDARSSLTLRYRYRFANATALLTAVAHGGNPLQPFPNGTPYGERSSYGRR